jgi:ubiquinone/menaquinone biosynthesis C-methylase UbiE
MGGLSEKTLNYQRLALIYDAIMGDHDGVDLYANMLQEVLTGKKILDCACGTGDLTVTLSRLGYQMTGLDISLPMLEIAKGKAERDDIRFVCADMLNLDLSEIFDSVVCANDSVNYCSSLEQLSSLFSGVNRHLAIGGVFVFDYHQQARLSEFQQPFEEDGVVNDLGYTWHIASEPPILRHTITIYGSGYPIVESHEQYVFELSEIQHLLKENGFLFELINPSDHHDLYLDEKWMIKAIKEKNV